jgi:hypothetical protein
MKTSSSAHRLARIRIILLCLAIAAIAGIEFQISQSLAARFGQTTARQSQVPQAPDVSLGDLMIAAR